MRTPCSHMLVVWLRSHHPYELVTLGALVVGAVFGFWVRAGL